MKTIKKETLTGRLYTNTPLHFSPQSCYIKFNIPKGFTKEDILGAKNVVVYQSSRRDLIALINEKARITVFTSQTCKEYDCSYEQALVEILDGCEDISQYITKYVNINNELYFRVGDRNYRKISGNNKKGVSIDIYVSPIDKYTQYIVIVENPKKALKKEIQSFLEYEAYTLADNNEKDFGKDNKPLGIKEVFEEPTYKLEMVVPEYMFLFQYNDLDFGSTEFGKVCLVGEPCPRISDKEFKNYREYSWTGKKKFKDGTSERGFFHTAYLYIDHKEKNDDGKTINKVRGKHQEWFQNIDEYIQTKVKKTGCKGEPKQLVILTKDDREIEYTMYEIQIDEFLPDMKERIYIHTLPNGDRLIFRTTDIATSQRVFNKILGFRYYDKTKYNKSKNVFPTKTNEIF